jgi:protein-S-isoprenylcysteine O-methyltransferase Ste14
MRDIVGTPTIRPAIFYSGKAAGYFLWALEGLSILKFIEPGPSGFMRISGVVSLCAGLLLFFLSAAALGRSTRLGLPLGETRFVSHGIYRFSRNPMYLAFNLVTLSSCFILQIPAVILLGAFSIVVYHRIILGEERYLEETFGEPYLVYKSKVRRYL